MNGVFHDGSNAMFTAVFTYYSTAESSSHREVTGSTRQELLEDAEEKMNESFSGGFYLESILYGTEKSGIEIWNNTHGWLNAANGLLP